MNHVHINIARRSFQVKFNKKASNIIKQSKKQANTKRDVNITYRTSLAQFKNSLINYNDKLHVSWNFYYLLKRDFDARNYYPNDWITFSVALFRLTIESSSRARYKKDLILFAKDPHFRTNPKLWSVLMNYLSKAFKDNQQVIQLFEEYLHNISLLCYKDQGALVDEFMFAHVIQSCLSTNEIEAATKYLKQMKTINLEPTYKIIEHFMYYYARRNQHLKVLEYLKMMYKYNYVMSIDGYVALLYTYGTERNFKMCYEIYNEIKGENSNTQSFKYVYLSMIRACLKINVNYMAVEFTKMYISKASPPYSKAFMKQMALLFAKNGYFSEVQKIIVYMQKEKMLDQNFVNTINFHHRNHTNKKWDHKLIG